MSILNRIRDALLDLVKGVEQRHDEVEEHFQQRRAQTLKEKLAALAKNSPYKNYLTSSEDLANLVKLDGSRAGRKEIWSGLNLEAEHGEYRGSGPQNDVLHAALMEWLATTGNVPRLVYE